METVRNSMKRLAGGLPLWLPLKYYMLNDIYASRAYLFSSSNAAHGIVSNSLQTLNEWKPKLLVSSSNSSLRERSQLLVKGDRNNYLIFVMIVNIENKWEFFVTRVCLQEKPFRSCAFWYFSIPTKSMWDALYFISFVEDCSRRTGVISWKAKMNCFCCIKVFSCFYDHPYR